MRRHFSSFFIFLLVAAIGILAYFLGKKRGAETAENIAMNYVLVQQIAELSSLEARGTASIKSSNITDDGSLSDTFRKLFMERTFNITVPYVAKYGVDLGKQKINIEEKNKQVYIVLPQPKLLSYEIRMDKADMMSRKGILETSDEETYNKLMQKLYAQSRAQLENNEVYKNRSKEKIKKIIEDYYAPLQLEVSVLFSDELKSKVTEPLRQ